MKKFTFKTEKSTGRFRSFFPPIHTIKLGRIEVGTITDSLDDRIHRVKFQVWKEDINEDGNPNCPWKWVTLIGKFNSVQEAKDFVVRNSEILQKKLKLYLENK